MLFRLERAAKSHTFSTMITQLIEHERIRTTMGKARALQPLAERVIAYQKRDNVVMQKKAVNVLTTDFAKEKLRKELAPRLRCRSTCLSNNITVLCFSERNGCVTRIVPVGKRRGDKAPMAYIEYVDK